MSLITAVLEMVSGIRHLKREIRLLRQEITIMATQEDVQSLADAINASADAVAAGQAQTEQAITDAKAAFEAFVASQPATLDLTPVTDAQAKLAANIAATSGVPAEIGGIVVNPT